MSEGGEDSPIPPFVIPAGWTVPDMFYPLPDEEDKKDVRRKRTTYVEIEAAADGVRGMNMDDKDKLVIGYKLGFIFTNRQTLESHKCPDEEADRLAKLLHDYQSLVHSYELEIIAEPQVPAPLREIDEKYYTYAYLRHPLKTQADKWKHDGSCWTSEDWFPIVGAEQSMTISDDWEDIVKEHMDEDDYSTPYRYGNITSIDWGTDNEGEILEMDVLTDLLQYHNNEARCPAHIWGDMSKGRWVAIDEASGWGALGKRKHPQNLTKKEHYTTWNKWTSDFLLKRCVTPEGNIIIGSKDAKGYDKDSDSWNQWYWPHSVFLNLTSARPMLPMQQILRASSWKTEGETSWAGRGTTQTQTQTQVQYDSRYCENYFGVSGGCQGFMKAGSAVRYSRMSENQFGTKVMMSYLTTANFSLFAKNRKAPYRKRIMVWLPEEYIDFTMYPLGIVN